jgi:putative lipoprotein
MPRFIFAFAIVSAVALLVAGCGGGSNKSVMATVSGTVTYLQSIELPPDAELRLALEDISLQDAPAGVIAQRTIPVGGKQSPLAFTIEYDTKIIEESHSYSVRAEILAGGATRFVTAQSYPVLTRGAPNNADVIVMALQAEAPANAPLVGTHWTLVDLGGQAVAKTPTGREPYLVLLEEEQRAVATGGCNQMSGTYQTSGAALTFSKLASTMKSCIDGMDRDQALAAALEATATFRVDGSRLEITDASGRVLARFDAAANEE